MVCSHLHTIFLGASREEGDLFCMDYIGMIFPSTVHPIGGIFEPFNENHAVMCRRTSGKGIITEMIGWGL